MKNKLLTFLTVTILAGSIFVGCGGNETGTETGANNGSGSNTNTEANVDDEVETGNDDTSTQVKYGVSNPDATYNETEYCYIVSDASFVEEKYNDGTEFDRTNWTPVNEIIQLNTPISIYNPFKDIMGYMKTDVTVVYVSVDGEWSYLGFAKEVANDGLYLNGGTYVRTDELQAVIAEVPLEEETNSGMSDKSEAYFNKIRTGIAEMNNNIDNILNENPEANVEHLVEVDSASGLECLGTFTHSFDNEKDYETLMDTIWLMNYNKYYIEYLDETDNSVEFKFYGAKYK